MPHKDKKSSGSSAGWIGLAAIVGAGVGFLISQILDDQSKKQKKSECPPPIVQKNQQCQFVKTNIDNYDDLQELMTCPITHQIMHEPCVVTSCGHSFEKQQIQDWIEIHGNCPLCKAPASQQSLKSNYQLKQIIHQYQRNRNNPSNGNNTQKQ